MKLYENGLIVGRFQMLHKGHVEIIRRALDLCNHVTVFIGSAQERGTERNPFSIIARHNMFEAVFSGDMISGHLSVLPLDDIGEGDNTNWGKYILDTYYSNFYSLPDLYITGCEKERSSWFDNTIAPDMDELRISRQAIKISGSDCRKALLDDNKEGWMKMVPYQLYDKYYACRAIMKELKNAKSND